MELVEKISWNPEIGLAHCSLSATVSVSEILTLSHMWSIRDGIASVVGICSMVTGCISHRSALGHTHTVRVVTFLFPQVSW